MGIHTLIHLPFFFFMVMAMFEAWKIVRKVKNHYVSAFTRCRKKMMLGKRYKSRHHFYVWEDVEDAKDVLRYLIEKRRAVCADFGIPVDDLVLTKVNADNVKKRYLEIGGNWPQGIPALKVKHMEIVEEVSLHTPVGEAWQSLGLEGAIPKSD